MFFLVGWYVPEALVDRFEVNECCVFDVFIVDSVLSTFWGVLKNPKGDTRVYKADHTYIYLHIAACAYMLNSRGRSPEARWRSQTEVVLRDRLIYAASGIITS